MWSCLDWATYICSDYFLIHRALIHGNNVIKWHPLYLPRSTKNLLPWLPKILSDLLQIWTLKCMLLGLHLMSPSLGSGINKLCVNCDFLWTMSCSVETCLYGDITIQPYKDIHSDSNAMENISVTRKYYCLLYLQSSTIISFISAAISIEDCS